MRHGILPALIALGLAPALAFAEPDPPTSVTFIPLGVLPGSLFSQPYHISRDGSTVVGSSPINLGSSRSFVWRLGTGMQELGSPPGFHGPIAKALSADGSIIAGNAFITADPNYRKVVRWNGNIPQTVPDPLPIGDSDAWDMNSDGSVMTGSYLATAYRWTAAGGFQDLGTLPGQNSSRGFGMSADGNVIVGETNFDAFRWTPSGMVALPRNGTASYARAQGVSGDGNVAVGESGSQAVRWVGTGPSQAMTLSGTWSSAYGVDYDGDTIVGTAMLPSGFSVATLWTPALGLKDLNTYLPTLGVDLTGWNLYEARSISSDGTVIVGTGYHMLPGGVQRQEAWVVMIPAPATSIIAWTGLVFAARRRR
jgi:uncharacterized membrane protein